MSFHQNVTNIGSRLAIIDDTGGRGEKNYGKIPSTGIERYGSLMPIFSSTAMKCIVVELRVKLVVRCSVNGGQDLVAVPLFTHAGELI